MVGLSSFNPACYVPNAVAKHLPSAIACAPPPSYFSTVLNTVTSPVSSTYTVVRSTLSTFIGLPFISLLFIPVTGSYTTTLNLVFFYITWSTLVYAHPPLRVELISTLAVRTICYLIPSLFFLGFDTILPSAAVGAKTHRNAALPFRNASRNKTLRLLRILAWSILNILLSIVLQVTFEFVLTRVLMFRSALRVTTELPFPLTMLKHIVLGLFFREILTYTIHRYTLHESKNVPAKLHRQWYHEIDCPFPLSASYDHPLPYLLHRFLPMYIPAALFRFHLLTYILYLSIVSLEESYAYSGYSTVPTYILGGIARRTDDHATEKGKGNYGCFGLVDWVMGTSIGEDLGDDMRQEAEEHDLRGQAERGVRKGVQKLNGKLQARKRSQGRRKGYVEGEVDD